MRLIRRVARMRLRKVVNEDIWVLEAGRPVLKLLCVGTVLRRLRESRRRESWRDEASREPPARIALGNFWE